MINKSFFRFNLFYLLMLVQLSSKCLAQQGKFKAVYEGKITTEELLKDFDSVNVSGNTEKIPVSAVPLMDIPVIKLVVLTDNENSVLKRIESSNVRDTSLGKSPDSTVYKHNAWYNYKDGKAFLKSPFTGNISKTDEKKVIKGYECVKYLWEVPLQKRTTELWITSALPFTISPFTVRIPIDGAIIESRQLGTNFTFTLTVLEKRE